MIGNRASSDGARKVIDAWIAPDALPHPYFFTRTLFPVAELSRLIEPRFRPSTINADGVTLEPTWVGRLERIADVARKLEPIAAVSWLEMRSYMVNTLLRDTDSVSMAQSLEVRVPLLDTPLVEFVGSLPDAARQRPGVQKALLGFERLEIRCRSKFLNSARERSLCHGRNGCADRCGRGSSGAWAICLRRLANHVHANGVKSVWQDFLAGKTSWSRPWSIYVLNEWCRLNLS